MEIIPKKKINILFHHNAFFLFPKKQWKTNPKLKNVMFKGSELINLEY